MHCNKNLVAIQTASLTLFPPFACFSHRIVDTTKNGRTVKPLEGQVASMPELHLSAIHYIMLPHFPSSQQFYRTFVLSVHFHPLCSNATHLPQSTPNIAPTTFTMPTTSNTLTDRALISQLRSFKHFKNLPFVFSPSSNF